MGARLAARMPSGEPEPPRPGGVENPVAVTDEALVSAAIGGDVEAFGELVLRHRPLALRVAATVVGHDRAEDVVQEALLLAYRALGTIRDRGRFSQWLMTITRFRALRVGRLETRFTRGRVVLDDLFLESFAAPRAGEDSRPLEMAEVLAALDVLPRAYAEVVRLHFLQDLPHEAISRRLGVPLSTVKWRCFRGKSLLRDQLAIRHPGRPGVTDQCDSCRPEGLRVSCSRGRCPKPDRKSE